MRELIFMLCPQDKTRKDIVPLTALPPYLSRKLKNHQSRWNMQSNLHSHTHKYFYKSHTDCSAIVRLSCFRIDKLNVQGFIAH